MTFAVVVTSNVVLTVSETRQGDANAVINKTAISHMGIIHITQQIKCFR